MTRSAKLDRGEIPGVLPWYEVFAPLICVDTHADFRAADRCWRSSSWKCSWARPACRTFDGTPVVLITTRNEFCNSLPMMARISGRRVQDLTCTLEGGLGTIVESQVAVARQFKVSVLVSRSQGAAPALDRRERVPLSSMTPRCSRRARRPDETHRPRQLLENSQNVNESELLDSGRRSPSRRQGRPPFVSRGESRSSGTVRIVRWTPMCAHWMLAAVTYTAETMACSRMYPNLQRNLGALFTCIGARRLPAIRARRIGIRLATTASCSVRSTATRSRSVISPKRPAGFA